jgi:hypothetical protein
MNLNEVVGEIVESRRSRMIFQFARKAILQARVTAHCGANRPILPFNKRS